MPNETVEQLANRLFDRGHTRDEYVHAIRAWLLDNGWAQVEKTKNEFVEAIRVERERQVNAEGWSYAHDDEHDREQLAWAAACYAAPEDIRDLHGHLCWPWDEQWDKRDKHSRERRLVIAGALIVAELERLKRARWKEDEPTNPEKHPTPAQSATGVFMSKDGGVSVVTACGNSGPIPSQYSREQVAEALRELAAEAKRLVSAGVDQINFSYVRWCGDGVGPCISTKCDDLLNREAIRLEVDQSAHWSIGYNVIAAAHGLPKLGEEKAKLPSIEELDSLATSDLSQWASPENDWSDFAPTPAVDAVMEAKPCGLDRTIAERVMRHQRINANPSEEFMASVVAELLAPQRAAAKELQTQLYKERGKALIEMDRAVERANELQAENERLKCEVGQLTSSFSEAANAQIRLQKERDALQTRLDAAEERVKELESDMAAYAVVALQLAGQAKRIVSRFEALSSAPADATSGERK